MSSRPAPAVGVFLWVVLAGSGFAAAQAPPSSTPSFEVASIKVNKEGGSSSVRGAPNGMLTITNNTLWNIIRNAYGLSGAQIVNTPGWLESDRFDITAKAATPFNQSQGMAMLRTLLAERFALVAHTETREMPVYLLVMAKKDGTLGPRLQKASVDCAALIAAVQAGGPMPAPGPKGNPPCVVSVRAGTVVGSAVSMEQLTRNLVNGVGRMVVDRTGLTGYYDLEMTFAPEPGLSAPGAQLPPADPSAPSLFTALQEQLGLKLEAGRASIEVLVIDRVERPALD